MSLLCKEQVLCCIIMFSHLEVKKSALLASVKTIQLEDICFDKQGFGKRIRHSITSLELQTSMANFMVQNYPSLFGISVIDENF